jgi:hypothetical protein
MIRYLKFTTLIFGLMLLSLFGTSAARAGMIATVSVDIVSEGSGMALYTYTVAVDPASTSAVSEFDLNITSGTASGINTPIGAPLSSITMANGFINLYTLGDPTISFLSTDPSTDIAPGTFGMFSFISTANPVLQPFQLSTFDGSGSTVANFVLGPTAVPEPSSVLLLGAGVIGVSGWFARGRFRKPTA